MLIEIPEFRRACFCLPLRYGIIILGYINLGVTIFLIYLEGMYTYYSASSPLSVEVGIHRGVLIPAPMWFILLLYSTEIILSVVLLIGAHKKICTLLNVFYYYDITTTLAAYVCLSVVWISCYQCRVTGSRGYIRLAMTFTSFVIHIYLLLLIRSELKKLRNCNSFVVVNHMTEVVIQQPVEEGRNPL